MHHQEVVQIKEVKSSETEETRNRGFPVTILCSQLKRRAFNAYAQINGKDDRAIDENRLGDNQQYRSSI